MAAERVPEGQAAPREGSNPGTSGSTSALPAIVIVSRDATARRDLRRELSKRYGADYQLVVCDEPTELATAIRKVKDTGAQIALVIGGLGGQDPGPESSVRKLLGVRHRQAVAETALGRLGPEGALTGEVQHEFLVTRCLSIAGGTTQVLLNITAERLLGLVRAHWQIENRAHWVRDTLFREDESRSSKARLVQVLGGLRCAALTLLHYSRRIHGGRSLAAIRRRLEQQPWEILSLTGAAV